MSRLEMLVNPRRTPAPVVAPVWLVCVDHVAPIEVRDRERLLPEFERLVRLYPGVRVRAGLASEVRP